MASNSGLRAMSDESAVVAPIVAQKVADELDKSLKNYTFPIPQFAKARLDERKRLLPQIIAHRGYKGRFPENSLLAFREAIRTGAHALETDVHLTKDEVVVLSHDANLKRFGYKKQILDCTWEEIRDYKTIASPHVPMLRLQDLLEYVLEPEGEDTWIFLDIKADNDTEDVMRLIRATIDGVQALPEHPWNQRILLALWAPRQIPLAARYLPGFSAVHVGFHLAHARKNLWAPHMGAALVVHTLMAPGGRRFLREYKAKSGPIMAWTVNDKDMAEWCARRGLDGIITDDPEAIVRIWEAYDERAAEPLVPVSIWSLIDIIKIYILVNCLFWWFRRLMKLDGPVMRKVKEEKKEM